MLSRRLLPLVVFLLAIFLVPSFAPLSAQQTSLTSAPSIANIDPPDWFTQLPDPMLLVHGSGFDHATFTLQAQGVALSRTEISANGHWAFLWLTTKGSQAQTVHITASNSAGSAVYDFALKAPEHTPESHQGLTPADALYLIMTDRFAKADVDSPIDNQAKNDPRAWHGGNLNGIRNHLDYLQSLGITALWTTPVYDNGSMHDSYHGYAATNYYAVDAHFGTLADYRALSGALHQRGLKLVIDMVPNHIGVQHPWVNDPPSPNWLHGSVANHAHSLGGDFYSLIDPNAPEAARTNLLNGWFVDEMPDLNQENPLVSTYLIQNALWWVETADLDAIRIDTFPYVDRPFWHDFHAALHAAYPNLTTVGEVSNGDPAVTSFFAGGRAHNTIDTGLDTPFDFPICFALRDTLAHDKPMTRLNEVLRLDALYPHPERLVHFFGNHDDSRFLTEAGGSIPRLKLALGLMASLRGTPQLYSGDEVGISGGDDPDNRHDFPGGFTTNTGAFAAQSRTTTQADLFNWTSTLLNLRKQHIAFAKGIEQNLSVDQTTFAFVRTTAPAGCGTNANSDTKFDTKFDTILAVLNKADTPRTLTIPTPLTALSNCAHADLLTPTAQSNATFNNSALTITLPAESFALFSIR